jgi:DNA invertase Pin-like site-specific DNA recombinase
MALYGYARVSTLDQDLTVQEQALRVAGCDVIRAEIASGAHRTGRAELETLLRFLRSGDTLIVTRIDRLARSIKDLQDIVHELKGRGVALKATEQPIDTCSAAGKAFLDMLGVFAESRPICAASANSMGSRWPRNAASIAGASREWTVLPCSISTRLV